MGGNLKPRALIAVAVVAVIAGVSLAVLSTGSDRSSPAPSTRAGSPSSRGGDLAAAAVYLGISPGKLRDDLRAGRTLADVANATSGRSAGGLVESLVKAKTARLEAAVQAGKLTPAKESARVPVLRERVSREVQAFGVGGGTADVAIAARYLGVPVSQVRRERRSGRSLAEIAGATAGRSSAGLIGAVVSAHRAIIEAAERSHGIGHREATTLLRTLQRRVTAEVQRAPGSTRGAG